VQALFRSDAGWGRKPVAKRGAKVSGNPARNSLLAGKIQGISFISGSTRINGKQKEELS